MVLSVLCRRSAHQCGVAQVNESMATKRSNESHCSTRRIYVKNQFRSKPRGKYVRLVVLNNTKIMRKSKTYFLATSSFRLRVDVRTGSSFNELPVLTPTPCCSEAWFIVGKRIAGNSHGIFVHTSVLRCCESGPDTRSGPQTHLRRPRSKCILCCRMGTEFTFRFRFRIREADNSNKEQAVCTTVYSITLRIC